MSDVNWNKGRTKVELIAQFKSNYNCSGYEFPHNQRILRQPNDNMKRVIFFVYLIIAGALPGMAQNQNPDMPTFINFSALSNSPPPPPGLWGGGDYFQITKPFLPGMPTYTNRLLIAINLPTPAVDGWIMEMAADGSLTPVAELTNQIKEDAGNAYFQQSLTLTTNQVHQLIAGNLYAAVDFGDSLYVGQFAPQYAFATGPTAKMIFPPAYGMNNVWGYTVISTNNRTARFILDSSNCTDPYYLPMQFFWVGYTGWYADPSAIAFTSTNAMVTNVFKVGAHIISLQASDIIATGKPFNFYVEVVTAGQAVNSFISSFQYASLPDRKKKLLLGVLTAAAQSFDKGKPVTGCALLKIYIASIKNSHLDSRLTSSLLRPMQDILDAFQPPQAASRHLLGNH